MGWIRKYAVYGLWIFLIIFGISVFGGLGIGAFSSINQGKQTQQLDAQQVRAAGVDQSQKDIAMIVNGRKVDSETFNKSLLRVQDMIRNQMPGEMDNPQTQLMAYGQTAASLMREEVLLAKAAELGLKVEGSDIKEERQKLVDAQGLPAETKSPNILGQATKSINDRREMKSVFVSTLSRMGLTESEWEAEISRTILQRKTREAMQKELDDAKDVKARATRDTVDAELAKGVEFKELAAKYSDAKESAKFGGDMQTFLLPGLLPDDKNDQTLMATNPGEMTPWFDVDAGYQRWQVYERVALDDKEFTTAKPKLEAQVKALKKDTDPAYKPTDEELKALAFKVKARQIMINKTDEAGMQQKEDDLYKAAVVEYNNPYVLAYQALYDEKLQPPTALDYDGLVNIAKKSAAAANYNFDRIKGKLERGKPQAAKEETPAAADSTADAGKPADGAGADAATTDTAGTTPDSAAATTGGEAASSDAAATDAAATSEAEPAAVPEIDDNPGAPIYALAVGLLEVALEGDKAGDDAFGQSIIAKVYLDWLDNEATLKQQPLDRDKAREEIETRLARALEKDDYNATLYADRGLNLAWLNKPDEAKAALEQAEKYAPEQDGGPLAQIKKAYEKLDMQDKAKAIQARMDTARQKQLQEQIQQQIQMQQLQQQQQGGAGGGQPINIPIGGQ
jgi:hypothetical protein